SFDSLEGADVQWRHSLAGYNGALQLIYGNSNIDNSNPEETAFDLKNIFGANYTLSRGDWSLRLGYFRSSEFSIDTESNEDFGGLIKGLGDQFEHEDLRVSFASVGLTYDDGSLLMMSELM